MSRKGITLLIACTGFVLTGCTTAMRAWTTEAVDLDYVGKVSLGTPVTNGKRGTIPVEFTGGKWMENPAVMFKKFRASQAGDEITITALTCFAGKGRRNKPEIVLKRLPPRQYQVVYLDPNGTKHKLGSVDLGREKPL